MHKRISTKERTLNAEETLSKKQTKKKTDILPVLVYVAEYAAYATLAGVRKCMAALTEKTKEDRFGRTAALCSREVDQGGLVVPTLFAVNAVAHNYVAVKQQSSRAEFFKMPSQR